MYRYVLILFFALVTSALSAQESDEQTPSHRDPVAGYELLTARSQFWLTDDTMYSRDAIRALAPSLDAPPQLYSLQWPLLLRNEYRNNGDTRFLREHLPGLRAMFQGFRVYETPSGLLQAENGELFDWPESMQEDFDYEYATTRENAVLNAFYYAALDSAAELIRELDGRGGFVRIRAERVKLAFANELIDPETGLVLDAPDSTHTSALANAVAVCFGLVHPDAFPRVLELFESEGAPCQRFVSTYMIEASFIAGDANLAYRFIEKAKKCPRSLDSSFLLGEYALGLSPALPGWQEVEITPLLPDLLDSLTLNIETARGKISAAFTRDTGLSFTGPPGLGFHITATGGEPIVLKSSPSHARIVLSEAQHAVLDAKGWADRVGQKTAIWIAADEQVLRVIRNDRIVLETPCATAKNGLGSRMNSLKTPLGWHSVADKIGDDAEKGQVFRAKQPTQEIWKPGDEVSEDLVLTRVLVLEGEEPGKNKGGELDSFARNIYIHGTNDEEKIGTPSSHGCVRLLSDDVIKAYELVARGAPVLITGPEPEADSD